MRYPTTIPLLIFVLATVVCLSCSNQNSGLTKQSSNKMQIRTIEQVLEENTQRLMLIKGVVGTAIGKCDDEPCIKILVMELTEELEMKLPKILENYPVFIEETGEIRAY